MTGNPDPMASATPRARSGCLSRLASIIIVPLFAYVLAAPSTFHLGGRWTPTARWNGAGRLTDSAGNRYGLYLRIWALPNMDFRNQMTTCCDVTGRAQVCTASAARYQFTVSGSMSGGWLHTDGAKVELTLAEAGHPKLQRVFQLSGVWRGPNLQLDDEKSMFIHFLPGGNLTPSPTYPSVVPEKHATVTVSWGDLSDFETVCGSLAKP